MDFAGIVAGKTSFAGDLGVKVGHHDRFAHEAAFDCAENLLTEIIAAHSGFSGDIGGFVDHLAGFGVNFLSGLQVHTCNLEIVALDRVLERLGRRRGAENRRGGV